MHRQGRWKQAVAVLAAIGAFAACGDDSPVGPKFGDLAFTPADTLVLGFAREGTATLSNVGAVDLGPIMLGQNLAVGRPPLEPEIFCDFRATIVPSQITSLSPGASANLDISVDDSNVNVQECLSGDYDIRVHASVDNLILGALDMIVAWETPQ
jgi:hypothetical protein